MARSEARISVDIWTDPDFLELSPGAQRLYLFLVSQPDVTHVGMLALRERRWARMARGGTVEQVRVDLLELAAERFIVLDEDTEEVLIRSFIRRDGVYRQPNLLRAAEKALALVTSPLLRASIAAELRRVVAAQDIPKSSVEIAERMLMTLGNPSPDPPPNPSEMPLGARGVVTAVTTGFPSPLAPGPLAPSPAPAAPRARATPAERIVLEHTDASPDEAAAVARRVQTERQPRSLPGLLRRMADDGDLLQLLADQRAAGVRAETRAALAKARDGPECEHRVPGGASPHPVSGEPICPQCRTQAKLRLLNAQARPASEEAS